MIDPRNSCPICGRSLRFRAKTTLLNREVHTPECFQVAAAVAIDALKARWPGEWPIQDVPARWAELPVQAAERETEP